MNFFKPHQLLVPGASAVHPMLNIRRPLIDTLPVERFINQMVASIEDGDHGMDLDGKGRVGKTVACVRADETFEWRGKRKYFFYFLQMTEHDRPTESYFFNTWLQAGNLKQVKQGPGNVGLERLATHLCVEANREGAEVIVTPIDEAQRLVDADYEHLLSLDNLIEASGKRLFAIFINQIDRRANNKEGIWTPSPHIVGRFKSKPPHVYLGLNGVEEVCHACDQYDTYLFWPSGSRITFVQSLAPALYARGWRLSAHAQQFVDAVAALRANHSQLDAEWTWPMKTFEAFVAYLLTRVVTRVDFNGTFSDADVQTALRRSGYLALEYARKGLIAPPEDSDPQQVAA